MPGVIGDPGAGQDRPTVFVLSGERLTAVHG
jgi:hypothetical protein